MSAAGARETFQRLVSTSAESYRRDSFRRGEVFFVLPIVNLTCVPELVVDLLFLMNAYKSKNMLYVLAEDVEFIDDLLRQDRRRLHMNKFFPSVNVVRT